MSLQVVESFVIQRSLVYNCHRNKSAKDESWHSRQPRGSYIRRLLEQDLLAGYTSIRISRACSQKLRADELEYEAHVPLDDLSDDSSARRTSTQHEYDLMLANRDPT